MYDLSNQFFALNVVSLYFVRWLTLEKIAPEILYSVSFGISTLFVAFTAPILGAASDYTNRRRPFLVYLTLIAVVFTMLIGVHKNILLGLFFFIIANYGCQTAIVFYNAMLVNIAPKDKIGLISGFGKMMGYTGAILALYLIKPIVLRSGYQATFVPTGLLFLFFSLPCLFFIKDKEAKGKIELFYFFKKEKITQIFKNLKIIVFDVKKYPGLLDFLKAAFFGLCAVNAIILFMSVYATRVFGMNEVEIIKLISFSTLFAILGSISSGFISDYLGHKRCLSAVFLLWGVCFCSGALIRDSFWYWPVGALVGTSLGATWVVSRALAIRLFPDDRIGEMFGLFNLVGYASAIVGPLFWGVSLWLFSGLGELGYRLTILGLSIFVLFGFIFLRRVPDLAK